MSPTRYTIIVRGRLSERFASALPGVVMTSGNGRTRLDTEPIDQSQLHGLLERLSNLAIELVSFQESGPTASRPGRESQSSRVEKS